MAIVWGVPNFRIFTVWYAIDETNFVDMNFVCVYLALLGLNWILVFL